MLIDYDHDILYQKMYSEQNFSYVKYIFIVLLIGANFI